MRRMVWAKHLRHASAQNIAIHCRHALHAPVLRMLLNQVVDFLLTVNGHAEQIVRKVARLLVHFTALAPKSLAHLLRRLLPHVPLEKHLQSQFTGFAASAHVIFSCFSFWSPAFSFWSDSASCVAG